MPQRIVVISRSTSLLVVVLSKVRLSAASLRSKTDLLDALTAWLANSTAATMVYGHISTWDTSLITDMSYLFCGKADATYTYCGPTNPDFGDASIVHQYFAVFDCRILG